MFVQSLSLSVGIMVIMKRLTCRLCTTCNRIVAQVSDIVHFEPSASIRSGSVPAVPSSGVNFLDNFGLRLERSAAFPGSSSAISHDPYPSSIMQALVELNSNLLSDLLT